MINKDNIIESGLLQQYLLGELSEADVLVVETIIENDSTIRAYYHAMEEDFLRLAQENSVVPPTSIKENILSTIELGKHDATPTPVHSIPNRKDNKRVFIGIAAALAAIFMLTSGWFYSRLDSTEKQLQQLTERNEILESDLEVLIGDYDEINDWLSILNSTDTRQYILEGNTLAPDAKVISYVNHQEKKVVINTEKLPKLEKDKDYQMWADVEGEMIDMGIISTESSLLAMQYIDDAESLNITIEPAGGNDHPTVEQLISNVYLE